MKFSVEALADVIGSNLSVIADTANIEGRIMASRLAIYVATLKIQEGGRVNHCDKMFWYDF